MAFTLNDLKANDGRILCPLSKFSGRSAIGFYHCKYPMMSSLSLMLMSAGMRSELYYGTDQDHSVKHDKYNLALTYISMCPGSLGNFISEEETYPQECCDNNYVHIQDVPATLWTVEHDLNKFCDTTIVNDDGEEIFGEVEYIDKNTLTVEFLVPLTGKVFCN